MNSLLTLAVLAGITFTSPPNAWAQTPPKFPSKPISILVASTPGGSADVETRFYVEQFQSLHKATMVVDYKPGASGLIAYAALIKAAPDGHTLSYSPPTIALQAALRDKLPFDVNTDLAPISQTTTRLFVLAVRTSFPADDYEGFVAYARANPGKVTWSTIGAGGAQHMTGEWLAAATGTKITFIHYKSVAPALIDIVAGRADAVPTSPLSVISQKDKLKFLAIITPQRSKLFPNLKTVAESGIPGFSYPAWTGIIANGHTPPELQKQISDMFRQALTTPKARQFFEAAGSDVVASTPEEFRKTLTSEIARWKKLATDNNIRLTDDNS